ncbi:MAG: SAM-dependent chlorinase/fluorinase, partial [Actinobacteria bacterium]|nr:SAM-dependent chlorinase/fluorinase [Actinomycetota bacterium]
RYGNLQLNAGSEDIDEWGESVRLRLDGEVRTVRRAATYGSIPPGRIGLVVDSYGLLSICVDRQSAAEELGLDVGDAVTLEALDSSGDGGDADSRNNATTAAVSVSLRPPSRSEPS